MLVQLEVKTGAHLEFKDITAQAQQAIAESGVQEGVCHLFVPHTTAGLSLNENWDPEVRHDLLQALSAMVPKLSWRHGEGNSPAHLLSSVVGVTATLLVSEGRLVLGSWQGIYLAEFDGPRRRRVDHHRHTGGSLDRSRRALHQRRRTGSHRPARPPRRSRCR
jgi:secondary thiamine-phosphate synthase enzyme